MHLVQEYSELLRAVITRAEQMVARVPPSHRVDSNDVITFLKTYGCEGYPVGMVGQFNIGPWLSREGRPSRQQEGVTIIPCFSDDVAPVEQSHSTEFVIPGEFARSDQVILLYHVDHWSLAELALTLLHEGRHARHRLGPKIASLAPVDRNDNLHETNTWLFVLNVLVAWGGEAWQAAVRHEVAWLEQRQLTTPGESREVIYATSQQYWAELDHVFGPTQYEHVCQTRQRLVSLQANMEYWSKQHPSFRPEQVCHALVSYHYR